MSTKIRTGYRSEFVEDREEFVVAGRHGGSWQECAHRERIDEPVVELLIAHGVGDRQRSRAVALRLGQHDALQVDAKIFLRGPSEEPLRVDRAGEVGVEVAALRHAIEERAQRGVIVARRREAGRGDDGVEFAGEQDEAEQDDEGRQEDNGKDDPAPQGFAPALLFAAPSYRSNVPNSIAGKPRASVRLAPR